MQPIEIITIIVCVLIVGGVLGSYIYKKIKHKPTGCSGCGGCSGCSGCSSKCDQIIEDAMNEARKKKEESKADEQLDKEQPSDNKVNEESKD